MFGESSEQITFRVSRTMYDALCRQSVRRGDESVADTVRCALTAFLTRKIDNAQVFLNTEI